MCGILAVFDSAAGKDLRTKAIKCSKKLRHRGPDWSGAVTRHNINEPIPNPLGTEATLGGRGTHPRSFGRGAEGTAHAQGFFHAAGVLGVVREKGSGG